MRHIRLKYLCYTVTRGGTPTYAEGDSGEARVIGQSCQRPDGTFDVSRMRWHEGELPRKGVVHGGEVVVNSTGTGTLGRSALLPDLRDQATFADTHVTVLRPRQEMLDTRFLAYVLGRRAFAVLAEDVLSVGATNQKELNVEALRNLAVPAPALSEQRSIVDFLDQEVARLDAAKAQTLSVLDRLADLRDGGLDELLFGARSSAAWFGDLPEGWNTAPLKSLAAGYPPFFTDGDWIESPYIVDDGIRLIQTGNVGRGRFVDQGFRYITEETLDQLRCTEVLPGDVLLSRLSPPVGRACLCPDLATRMIASVDVAILRPRADVESLWLVALCSSDRYLAWLDLESRGATMQRVSRSQLGNVRLPVPPRHHQRRIAEAWSRITTCEARARDTGEATARALAAYRDSLIHEAVSGKLDVTQAGEVEMEERMHAAVEGRLDEVVV